MLEILESASVSIVKYTESKALQKLLDLPAKFLEVPKEEVSSSEFQGILSLEDEWELFQAAIGFFENIFLFVNAKYYHFHSYFNTYEEFEWVKDQTYAEWLVDLGKTIDHLHRIGLPYVQAAKYLSIFRMPVFLQINQNLVALERDLKALKEKTGKLSKPHVNYDPVRHNFTSEYPLLSHHPIISLRELSDPDKYIFSNYSADLIPQSLPHFFYDYSIPSPTDAKPKKKFEKNWKVEQYETLIVVNKALAFDINSMSNPKLNTEGIATNWCFGLFGFFLEQINQSIRLSRNLGNSLYNNVPSLFYGETSCKSIGDHYLFKRLHLSSSFSFHSSQTLFQRSLYQNSTRSSELTKLLSPRLEQSTESLKRIPFPFNYFNGINSIKPYAQVELPNTFTDFFDHFGPEILSEQSKIWHEFFIQRLENLAIAPSLVPQSPPAKLILPYAFYDPVILRLYYILHCLDVEGWILNLTPKNFIQYYYLDQIENHITADDSKSMAKVLTSIRNDPNTIKNNRELRLFPVIKNITIEGQINKIVVNNDVLLVSKINLPNIPAEIKIQNRCGYDVGSPFSPYFLTPHYQRNSNDKDWPKVLDRKTALWNSILSIAVPFDQSQYPIEDGKQFSLSKNASNPIVIKKDKISEQVNNLDNIIATERFQVLWDVPDYYLWLIKDAQVWTPIGYFSTENNFYYQEHYLIFDPSFYGFKDNTLKVHYDEADRFIQTYDRYRKAFILNSFISNYFHFMMEDVARLTLMIEVGAFSGNSNYKILDDSHTLPLDKSVYAREFDKFHLLVPFSTHSFVNQTLFILGFTQNDVVFLPQRGRQFNDNNRNFNRIVVDQLYTLKSQLSSVESRPQSYDEISDILRSKMTSEKEIFANSKKEKIVNDDEILIENQEEFYRSYMNNCWESLGPEDIHTIFMVSPTMLRIHQKRILHNVQYLLKNNPLNQLESASKTLSTIQHPAPMGNSLDKFQFTNWKTHGITGLARNLIIYTQRSNNRRRVNNELLFQKTINCIISKYKPTPTFPNPIEFVIHTGSESLITQIERFNRALVIAGPTGAGLYNSIFAYEGTSVVQLPRRHGIDNTSPLFLHSMNQFNWIVPALNSTESGQFMINNANNGDLVRTVLTSLYTTARYLHSVDNPDPEIAARAKFLDVFLDYIRSIPLPMNEWPFSSVGECLP